MLDRMGYEAWRQQAGVLQCPRHGQRPGIHWTQSRLSMNGRDACLRLRVERARALAASRLITSTVCPALAARPPIAAALPPLPMMLIALMCSSLLVCWVLLVLPNNHARHITCNKQVNSEIYLQYESDVNI